jgi:hypothetical protein
MWDKYQYNDYWTEQIYIVTANREHELWMFQTWTILGQQDQ